MIRAVSCDPWMGGGRGCEALAHEVAAVASRPAAFKPMYDRNLPVIDKLRAIVDGAYGGAEVELSDTARRNVEWAEKNGFGDLPISVAKTQYSVTDDPSRLNAPSDFTVHVREVRVSAGARFLVAICGEIMLMPGLGKAPTAHSIDVDDAGEITGLF